MPDAIAATIKFIQRNHILGIVIPDYLQHTELTFYFLSLKSNKTMKSRKVSIIIETFLDFCKKFTYT